jgi:hypothetical protein
MFTNRRIISAYSVQNAFLGPGGSSSERANEYRLRAQQISSYAGTLTDSHLRSEFLKIALSYENMAEYLEKEFGFTRAVQMPTHAGDAVIAAAVVLPQSDDKND